MNHNTGWVTSKLVGHSSGQSVSQLYSGLVSWTANQWPLEICKNYLDSNLEILQHRRLTLVQGKYLALRYNWVKIWSLELNIATDTNEQETNKAIKAVGDIYMNSDKQIRSQTVKERETKKKHQKKNKATTTETKTRRQLSQIDMMQMESREMKQTVSIRGARPQYKRPDRPGLEMRQLLLCFDNGSNSLSSRLLNHPFGWSQPWLTLHNRSYRLAKVRGKV